VASTTLREPLEWRNSIEGDVAKAAAELNEQTGKNPVFFGSGSCRQS
jgi:hypothetical protein